MTRTPPISTLSPTRTLFRSESGGLQRLLDRLHELLLPELAAREVHRHDQRSEPGVLPCLALRPGGAQEPLTDRQDEPGLLRERLEEHTSELQSPCNIVCRLL